MRGSDWVTTKVWKKMYLIKLNDPVVLLCCFCPPKMPDTSLNVSDCEVFH